MLIAEAIQTAIHKMEMGVGVRVLRVVLLILAIFTLALLYDARSYRNLFTPEGMDTAQLARNIATGKGYTTEFIRPLSLYLVQSHNENKGVVPLTATNFDFARIQNHPDLANPPVYPLVLAGLMKVRSFHYAVDLKKPFWSDSGRFSWYQPDFLIAAFNQLLLLAMVVIVFFLARKLFDPTVAWLSAGLTIGCETFWHFSTSGLSTMLLMLIFLGLSSCLLKIEELAREPQPRMNHLLGWVLAAGALAGVGALTRYAFGWVIVPVVIFLALFSGQRRTTHALLAFGVFVVMLTPWVIRNFVISGTLFGTAGFAAMEQTTIYPQYLLERSLHPNFFGFLLKPYVTKVAANLRGVFSADLPTLGGSWASVFFLAGLMLGFRKAPVQRLRYFLLMCLGMFIFFQALGRTQLSDESPGINSENLLVVLAPVVFIYGVSLFLTLLDQLELPMRELRYLIIAIFAVLSCLPMIFVLLPPKTKPVIYPPYFPPQIQQTAGWMKPDELMMSDVPWAVAWYGDRQCVWLSLDAQDAFFDINDNIKTISAFYLTPKTLDGRLLTEGILSQTNSWGYFITQIEFKNTIPSSFPLHAAPTGFLPACLFLTDYPRWPLAK